MKWEQYKIEVSKELQKQAGFSKADADNYAKCFDESFECSKEDGHFDVENDVSEDIICGL